MTVPDWVILAIRVLAPVLAIMLALPIPMWLERRGAGLIQDRPGPNRVGPFGLMQPVADAVKFFMKEDLIPSNADRFLYVIAPGIALFSALMTFAVIPYGPNVTVGGREIPLVGADVSIGILYLFALTSLSVYGIVLGGWSSNNKFSLIGGIRSSAQIISYELAMTTAAAGVILAAGSFRLTDVVAMQAGTWFGFIPRWNVLPQFLGFVVFYVATFAETNRLPFDLPEAEAELVGGYHTEYSAFKFAMFFMAEYVNMIVASALTVTLFFGGWTLPGYEPHGAVGVLVSALVFFGKTAFLVWVFIWVRWTLPRFRYDQLMRLGWKALLPIALLNLFWIAFLVVKGWLA
ncbi:MAG TPA: NADH-quinone oxidoreductase subunit NuoH [Patescibacteria group bacterium]|nr:NADH-quinone oxidoreductase subunit NuoH [Patescibacteria group bacterium]